MYNIEELNEIVKLIGERIESHDEKIKQLYAERRCINHRDERFNLIVQGSAYIQDEIICLEDIKRRLQSLGEKQEQEIDIKKNRTDQT